MTRREPFSYRSDPAVPPFADDQPIIVFDGKCVLCSGFANLVMRRDLNHRFRLLAAQTPLGAALYRHFGLDPIDYETAVLIEGGEAFVKSDASIRILARLGLPWSLARLGRLIPLRLRDRLYDFVARNRFRWFGRREACYLPAPSDADRFIA
jgi:predicted DCC family thiol-disulfide oxidoreductase YuxK